MLTTLQPDHPIAKTCVGILLFLAGCFMVGCSPSLPDTVEEAYAVLPDEVDYNFHVKPILADRCYA